MCFGRCAGRQAHEDGERLDLARFDDAVSGEGLLELALLCPRTVHVAVAPRLEMSAAALRRLCAAWPRVESVSGAGPSWAAAALASMDPSCVARCMSWDSTGETAPMACGTVAGLLLEDVEGPADALWLLLVRALRASGRVPVPKPRGRARQRSTQP